MSVTADEMNHQKSKREMGRFSTGFLTALSLGLVSLPAMAMGGAPVEGDATGSRSDVVLLIAYVLLALVFSFLCSVAEAVLLSITPSYIAGLEESRDLHGDDRILTGQGMAESHARSHGLIDRPADLDHVLDTAQPSINHLRAGCAGVTVRAVNPGPDATDGKSDVSLKNDLFAALFQTQVLYLIGSHIGHLLLK